jgi:integrase
MLRCSTTATRVAKISLSAKSLQVLSCPPGSRKAIYRDANCKGLSLEVRSTEGKTWYLTYTNRRGKRHQHRLGDLQDLSLSQARTLADQCRTTVAMGGDPAEEQALLRQTPTFAAFIEEQYLPFIQTYKRSWKCDLSTLRVHLLPVLGERQMDTIKRTDVLALQQQWIRDGFAAGTINKYLVLLRYVFNLAIRWEVPGVTVNPTKDVALLQVDNKRQRFLTADEAQALIDAVRHSENPVLESIVSMLLITGARKREVLDARWEDIDWQRRLWKIPKTKAGKARYVPLSAAALDLLESRKQPSGRSGFIFPNPKTDKPFQSVYYSWDTARKQAGLDDLRMHDLRHSFASFLINGGRSLYEVQQLLGHSNSQMTQRYAHLAHETLLDASDVAGGLIARLNRSL